jgi:cell division septation protein DedD
MPLNTQQDEESVERRSPVPETVVPVSQAKNPHVNRIVGIMFFILVLAAVIFLLFAYDLLNTRRNVRSAEVTNQRLEQSNPPPGMMNGGDSTAPASSQAVVQDTSRSVLAPSEKGQFSIYIASYSIRGDAENEVARWREAGYDAFVYDIPGWSRVALGHFGSIPESQPMIDSLQEAFEQGYWVGPS